MSSTGPSGALGRALQELLQASETVLGYAQGRGNQIMVATNQRVIIIKKGLATGGVFGTNNSSYHYHQITSIDVRKALFDGYVEISAGGVAQMRRLSAMDQMTAPNTLQYFKTNESAVLGLVNLIREQINAAYSPPVAPTIAPVSAPIAQISIPEQIKQLAQLRDQGILTAEEFDEKKRDLLARM